MECAAQMLLPFIDGKVQVGVAVPEIGDGQHTTWRCGFRNVSFPIDMRFIDEKWCMIVFLGKPSWFDTPPPLGCIRILLAGLDGTL